MRVTRSKLQLINFVSNFTLCLYSKFDMFNFQGAFNFHIKLKIRDKIKKTSETQIFLNLQSLKIKQHDGSTFFTLIRT